MHVILKFILISIFKIFFVFLSVIERLVGIFIMYSTVGIIII